MVGCHFSGLSLQCLSPTAHFVYMKEDRVAISLKRGGEMLFLTESQWRRWTIKRWENSLKPLIVIMPKATRATLRDGAGRGPLVRCRARPWNTGPGDAQRWPLLFQLLGAPPLPSTSSPSCCSWLNYCFYFLSLWARGKEKKLVHKTIFSVLPCLSAPYK